MKWIKLIIKIDKDLNSFLSAKILPNMRRSFRMVFLWNLKSNVPKGIFGIFSYEILFFHAIPQKVTSAQLGARSNIELFKQFRPVFGLYRTQTAELRPKSLKVEKSNIGPYSEYVIPP